MTVIHPTAIIDPAAKIGKDSIIGPYCIIGPNVQIGEGCEIRSHAVLSGHTVLGDRVQVYPFAAVGSEPQHLGYAGEPTRVEIGGGTIIRESATIHRGTIYGHGITRVGENCFIMAYSHVAHDCTLGRGVILANSVQLAGHVSIEDFANIGGASEVAQYCRVGRYCYIGGSSALRKDLPPFMTGKGKEFEVQGANSVGLKRKGFSSDAISRIREIYRVFYLQNLTTDQAVQKISDIPGAGDEVKVFLDFVKASKMGFIR